MIMPFKYKFITLFLIFICIAFNTSKANVDDDFKVWAADFKEKAVKKGISQETVDKAFSRVKFLENVIKYDRKQPEFFEDTETYISKRANASRVKNAKRILKLNKELFNEVEKNFSVEKEILLSLWGIETNFGKHVGKMDIISSLATLSFDKRRSQFFSNQLLILLKLIDEGLIEIETLFGSWAGAYGNFQFMPSTIKSYAIDYDGNNKIELKNSLRDSLASAANYIHKIGWKKDQPCFYRVKLNNPIKNKYVNTSARNISNKMKISEWKKKGVVNIDGTELKTNLNAALIMPDGDGDSPIFLVFQNYEKILKWNRSLRFGLTVCTLANMIKT